MKIVNLKKMSLPKIAVLATGLTAAILVATVGPTPAQAYPTYNAGCSASGCHSAGGSVTATPSSASLAPGAAYTVALAFTGGTGSPIGYAITASSITGSINAANAGPASMTAPAAAGTYTYTVWMRSGVVATTTYSITVAAVATTPAATTTTPAATTTTPAATTTTPAATTTTPAATTTTPAATTPAATTTTPAATTPAATTTTTAPAAVTPSSTTTASTALVAGDVVTADGSAVIPVGAPNTGAGGTAGSNDGLIGLGGLALLLAGAAATQVVRRRQQV